MCKKIEQILHSDQFKEDLTAIIKNIKKQIDLPEIPEIDLTIGINKHGKWDFQTGDNSFSGNAYGYPLWAVISVTINDNPSELADDIINQIENLAY